VPGGIEAHQPEVSAVEVPEAHEGFELVDEILTERRVDEEEGQERVEDADDRL
jgi:hypothetical protein